MKEERINQRKLWKKTAKQVIRTHYVMAVILCMIAVFFGTEFVFIRTQAENLYAITTGQEIRLGGSFLKLDSVSARDKVISDLIEDNINAGRQDAAAQLEQYRNTKISNSVLGRQKGIFASVANTVSSGHLYMILFGGLHSLLHSTRIASGLVVLGSLILSVMVWIFLKNMYRAILRRSFMEARLYDSVPMSHLLHFRLMRRWTRAALTLLLQSVFEFLWALTVAGIFIKHFSYILVPYIVAENPDIRPREAIRLSSRMMNGHKWECFKLHLTFIGWYLLGIVTFGVTDVFWTLPYEMAVFCEFYASVRSESLEKGIEGSERLNDTYLYVKAEEAFLRRTYQDIEEQKHFIDEHRVTLPPVRRFFAKNFGLWTGSAKEKAEYDEVDTRRQQIVEDRAVIKGKIYPQRLAPLWDSKNNRVVRKIRFIRTYTIWSVILAFFTFAFVGWVWEVSLHLIGDGVFVNRGVMHGPWLPIYGSGVVMIMLVLARWRSKPVVEAAAIVLLCGAVEYGTSYVLEAVNGMRWWDYTGYFLNLNGRICGEGLMVFALGGMAAVYLLLPILDSLWSRIRPKVTVAICAVLVLAFCADMVYTHKVPNVGEGITDYTAYEEVGKQ